MLAPSAAEEQRQREVSEQIQRLLQANPALQATVGNSWIPCGDAAAARLDVKPASVAASKAAPEQSAIWRVVGGASGGGIIVRAGKSKTSPKRDKRLSVGSRVREIEFDGDRLHYELVAGEGPAIGWVSTKITGAELLIREVPAEESPSQKPGTSGAAETQAPVSERSEAKNDRARGSRTSHQAADTPDRAGAPGDSLSVEDILARIDHDQEEEEKQQELVAQQQDFFNLSAAPPTLDRWAEEAGGGLVLGRGAGFNFAAIRELGGTSVTALAIPATSARACQESDPTSHRQEGQASTRSLRSRLQAVRPGAQA